MIEALDDFDGLLNWEALQAWAAGADLPGSGPIDKVTRITGGSQNNIFMLERGGERMVLRRPPKHLRPNSNKTMEREAQLLAGLKGSDVPHAELYAACGDQSVIGASFYIMAPLDGFSPLGELPGQYGTDPSWRREMGADMVRAAAALSQVDYKARGTPVRSIAGARNSMVTGRWRAIRVIRCPMSMRSADGCRTICRPTGRSASSMAIFSIPTSCTAMTSPNWRA
jgi:aminoglycoside phosphotransferase (APT) family kinase protein